jgi:hypothetical protein
MPKLAKTAPRRTGHLTPAGEAAERTRRGEPRGLHAVDSKGARIPAFEPTDDHRGLVRILAANGVTLTVIAQAIGCSAMTLTKYFRKEIDEGKELVVAMVGAAVVQEALNGNVGAARYWLATHAGPEWRMPKDDAAAYGETSESDDVVHFYFPSNGRDRPEPEEPAPVIDGTMTEVPDDA